MTASVVTRIAVRGESAYDVVVGAGVVADHLPPLLAGVTRAAVVAPDGLSGLAEPAVAAVRNAGVELLEVTVPPGEAAKTAVVLEQLWEQFGAANLTRSDLVVAVGGGATTDVAGFAAATWLRGIRWVPVPTTLLGMVDAAIGGKTAIDTAAGKNLAGAFHPPAAVLVDVTTLRTLPAEEWVNGMAEVAKAGMIADPEILDLVDHDPEPPGTGDLAHAQRLIERSVSVKAEVVSRDLREAGPREFLNYGHTLGHAIERVENYTRPHGHAVAIGMTFAAGLSVAAGRLDPAIAHRQRALLERIGLPTRYDGPGAWPDLLAAMRHDKKARGATLRFVVLDGVGAPAVLPDPAEEWLAAAWAEVAA